jgi:hypothetical protein
MYRVTKALRAKEKFTAKGKWTNGDDHTDQHTEYSQLAHDVREANHRPEDGPISLTDFADLVVHELVDSFRDFPHLFMLPLKV